jgi:hypothetical protein
MNASTLEDLLILKHAWLGWPDGAQQYPQPMNETPIDTNAAAADQDDDEDDSLEEQEVISVE